MSTIIASNISDGTTSVASTYVVNGSAKAWVNFNGTGTVAIRDSLNVSSITDNGTGTYTVNFTTAMQDANYCAVGSTIGSIDAQYATYTNSANTALSTSSVTIEIRNSVSGSVMDQPCVNVVIFR